MTKWLLSSVICKKTALWISHYSSKMPEIARPRRHMASVESKDLLRQWSKVTTSKMLEQHLRSILGCLLKTQYWFENRRSRLHLLQTGDADLYSRSMFWNALFLVIFLRSCEHLQATEADLCAARETSDLSCGCLSRTCRSNASTAKQPTF